jgi:hypothetical protein
MKPRFRLKTLFLALALGCFSVATIVAETLTPRMQGFFEGLAPSGSRSYDGFLVAAAGRSLLRGDLLANVALARAATAIEADKAAASPDAQAKMQRALGAASRSLARSPHLSGVWLLVALLQGQARESNAEALKMSYLTSPADITLIPTRLAVVSTAAVISDDELKNLARGDMRLILTRRPDLKPVISNAYRRGSTGGKAYINEVVQLIDPAFAASLH